MIPNYPTFRPLLLEDKPAFDRVFAETPPQLSEYTFANLYSWRASYHLEVSMSGGFILVKASVHGRPCFFLPLGNTDPHPVMRSLLSVPQACCIRIPAPVASAFEKDDTVRLVSDRDNEDYLYRTEDLIALKGTGYDGKRNLIKNFKARNRFEYLPLDPSRRAEWAAFEEEWCQLKDCGSIENLQQERIAFQEMLAHYDDFGLVGGAIRVENVMRAAALAGRLNPQTMVMHILKADSRITGLYQVMMHEFLRRETRDFPYINLEQDLGVAGLRKAKMSYHPCAMVACYSLEPAPITEGV